MLKIRLPKPVIRRTGLVRALLVGNDYIGTPYELSGCINDSVKMRNQLANYFPNCEIRVLNDASRKDIFAGITWLLNGLTSGQNIMFHYSGHGGRVVDRNGDEVSGLDSCIYPVKDGELEQIIDDELRNELAVKVPAGSKCFVVLDSCHSGSAVDLRCTYQAPKQTQLTFSENKNYAKTPGTVLFLSGCRDTEYAYEDVDLQRRPCGALTNALLETWKTYGRGIKTKYLLWDVRTFLRNRGYPQIPQLSTGKYMDLNQVFDLT